MTQTLSFDQCFASDGSIDLQAMLGQADFDPGQHRIVLSKVQAISDEIQIIQKIFGQDDWDLVFIEDDEALAPYEGYTPALVDQDGDLVASRLLDLPLHLVRGLSDESYGLGEDIFSPADQAEEAYRSIEEDLYQPMLEVLFSRNLDQFLGAYDQVFDSLQALDDHLAGSRFLTGDYISLADIKLFCFLTRFDIFYAKFFAPAKHRLVDYANLWSYARDLYQIPVSWTTICFDDFIPQVESAGDNKDYWVNTYFDIVLPQTDLDEIWRIPHRREVLSQDPAHKFRFDAQALIDER